eukprot:scaffold68003_cov19-Tisochrysis_lutea.AAC.1
MMTVMLLLLLVELHKPRVAVIAGSMVRAVAATMRIVGAGGRALHIDKSAGEGCRIFCIGVLHASTGGGGATGAVWGMRGLHVCER